MKVLNVGGGTKSIPIPQIYSGWDHLLLDIADGPDVDIAMDTREMEFEDEFDAVYCSHNLEHYPAHDVSLVLSKFKTALIAGGHVDIHVPDLGAVFEALAKNGHDLNCQMYMSAVGPISARDMLFGAATEVEKHGDPWGHKTGFTKKSLGQALEDAGFVNVVVDEGGFNLHAIGWKEESNVNLKRVLSTPEFPFTKESVLIGFAHNGQMRHEFHRSIANLGNYDARNKKCIAGEVTAGGPYITENRNMICDQALQSQAEWLFMLDNDVEFPPDILDRLLAVADPIERPILGAVYFTQINGYWMPVWLEQVDGVGRMPVEQITIGEIKELDAIGMGCTLIHRTVLEKMKAEHSDDPWPWFNHDLIDGGRAGEDVSFCNRAKKMGLKIHGFAYPLVHMKTYAIDWQTFNDQYRLAALDRAE